MANTNPKANSKQQTQNNASQAPSNVWYFEQFKKNADQWRESVANNMAYDAWQGNQAEAANQMQKVMNSTLKSASNLMEHSSEYCSSYVSKCHQAVAQGMEQASNVNSLVSESTAEAARIASQTLNCRTPEDCRNLAQDCMNSTAQLAQQCIVTSAQSAVDTYKAIAKPLSQNTLSLQEAWLRACCDASPIAQWCKATSK